MKFITIYNENLTVTINYVGAELNSVKFKGKERLWNGDSNFWGGHSPVLFPVAGALYEGKYSYNGTTYQMPFHGLVRKKEFTICDIDEDMVSFVFSGDEETRKFYPFNFNFYVTYKLIGNSIQVTYKVVNKDDKKLWFTFGSHESFAIDYNLQDYSLEFEKDEIFKSYIAGSNGLDTVNTDDFGRGKNLQLSEEKFVHGTIILLNVNSRKVNLLEKGKKIATMDFDTKNLLCWTVKGAKFVCIEPWNCHPDYEGFNDDITKKSGVILLEKDEEYKNIHTITYFE